MKRYYLCIVTVLIFILLSSCAVRGGPIYIVASNKEPDDPPYNLLAKSGLEFFIENDDNWNLGYKTARIKVNYQRALNDAISEGGKLIFSLDPLMGEYVNNLAKENPSKKFVIIDWVPPSPEDYLENTAYVSFKENEGSFLVGIAASLNSESGLIGFVGAEDIPGNGEYEKGYKAGARYGNPESEVLVEYIESINDEEKAYEAALKLIEAGAEVIYHAAGSTAGKNVGRACLEKEIWFIGNDKQQSSFAPDYTLTSMLKRIDVVVKEISQSMTKNKFPGGVVTTFGLAEFGLDYENTRKLSYDMVMEIDDVMFMTRSGDLDISDLINQQ